MARWRAPCSGDGEPPLPPPRAPDGAAGGGGGRAARAARGRRAPACTTKTECTLATRTRVPVSSTINRTSTTRPSGAIKRTVFCHAPPPFSRNFSRPLPWARARRRLRTTRRACPCRPRSTTSAPARAASRSAGPTLHQKHQTGTHQESLDLGQDGVHRVHLVVAEPRQGLLVCAARVRGQGLRQRRRRGSGARLRCRFSRWRS